MRTDTNIHLQDSKPNRQIFPAAGESKAFGTLSYGGIDGSITIFASPHALAELIDAATALRLELIEELAKPAQCRLCRIEPAEADGTCLPCKHDDLGRELREFADNATAATAAQG